MNARIWTLAIAATLLSACNSSTSDNPTTPNNPSSTVITVYSTAPNVDAGITVTMSTALNGTSPAGTTITSGVTGSDGTVTLTGLPATGTLCISATKTTGGHLYAAGHCASQPYPTTDSLSLGG